MEFKNKSFISFQYEFMEFNYKLMKFINIVYRTPLIVAILSRNIDIIKLLLSNKNIDININEI